MEDEKKEPKTYLNYGILTGVILIVLFVLYYVFNLLMNKSMQLLPIIVFFILIIIAQIMHARSLNGNITYGNLFAMGFKTTAAATAIYVVFLIIFLMAVPSYKDQVIQAAQQKLVGKGLSSDQINTSISMYKKAFSIMTISFALIGTLIEGLIASLIGAAVAKKNPQPQSTQF